MRPGGSRAGIFRYATFDVTALCQLASGLRNGQACSCDLAQVPASGSVNWAILISFDDGLEWVLRSPRRDGAIRCHDTNGSLLASEAATLRYLRSYSNVPVPEIYAYSLSRHNEIGIPYILMSKASGFPLQRVWKNPGANEPMLSQKNKMKVLSQLGAISWELSRLRFDRIGSLFEEDGHFKVKNCLSRGLTLNQRYSLEELSRGPFSSASEYYSSHLAAFLQHAESLPLGHHCFFAPIPNRSEYGDTEEYRSACDQWNNFVTLGSKVDGSDNRLDYVIAGDRLPEMISTWLDSMSDALQDAGYNTFPLHHPDLSVNNIFVDCNYNITCIIDWAFASTVPLPVALTAPGLPQSRDELDQPLVTAFENGFKKAALRNRVGKSSKSVTSLLGVLQNSRFMWLLCRLLCFDSTTDYHLFCDLWRIVYPGKLNISIFFQSKQSSNHYVQLHDEVKQYDEPAERTKNEEIEYFQNDVIGITISRKLTLVSEWTTRFSHPHARGIRRNGTAFVADRKLWRWISKFLEQSAALNCDHQTDIYNKAVHETST